MNRNTVFTLSMLIVLISSMVVSGSQNETLGPAKFSTSPVSLEQLGTSDQNSPIFFDVLTSDSKTVLRERNDTNGEGAITQVQEYTNLTIRYAVALQNTSTFTVGDFDFRLYADLPVVNSTAFNNTGTNTELSLTDNSKTLALSYNNQNQTGLINYTLPFNPDVTIANATLYFFDSPVINMSVSYLPFFVVNEEVDGLSELQTNGAYNLLTTSGYFTTSSQDTFYVQDEEVRIFGNVFNVDNETTNLGLSYSVNSGNSQEVNFTLVFDGNNATANVTFGPYEPGSIFEWSSILYAGNDTLINQSRIIDRIDHKLVEIGDGSPTLSIEIDANDADSLIRGTTIYTRNASVTFIVLTTVPKGNITGLSLLKVDNDTSPLSFTPINGSLQDIELNTTVTYPSEGIYNATVLAETDKGLSYNLTYTIYVDQTLPTVASLSTVGGGSLVTTDGRVTFNFEFADGLSGVKVAILDTGDGQSVDVTNMDEYTHRYMDYESNTYRYQLTVIDFAGNVFVTDTISVSLSVDTSQATRAPSTGVIFFFIALIALFTSPIWGPRIVEALQDRF